MKKTFALFLVLATLIGSVFIGSPAVYAANVYDALPAGWLNRGGAANTATHYSKTTDDAFTGDRALKLVWPTNNGQEQRVGIAGKRITGGNPYTLSFAAKGSLGTLGFRVVNPDANFSLAGATATDIEGSGGWQRYTLSITLPNDSLWKDTYFVLNGSGIDCTIDDISLRPSSDPTYNVFGSMGSLDLRRDGVIATGWYTETSGDYSGMPHYLTIDAGNGYNSSASLTVGHRGETANTYRRYYTYAYPNLTAGEYIFSFKLKNAFNKSYLYVGVDWDRELVWSTQGNLNSKTTETSLGDGWYQYDVRFTNTKDRGFWDNKIGFFFADIMSTWFDDVKCYRADDPTQFNYIVNGSFEDYYKAEEYQPLNLMCQERDGTLVFSWMNQRTVGDVNLMIGGYPVPFTKVLGEGKTNEVIVSSLTNGTPYTATLQMSVGGSVVSSTQITGTPTAAFAKNSYTVSGHNIAPNAFVRSDNPTNTELIQKYANVTAALDKEIKTGGQAALHLTSNCIPGTEWQDNVYGAYAIKTAGIESGKTYQVSFNARFNAARELYVRRVKGGSTDATQQTIINDSAAFRSMNWKRYTSTFTADSANYDFWIIAEKAFRDLWIDDFTIYELSGTEPVGTNLALGGGFEYELQNAALTAGQLTWEIPAGATWDGVNVYYTLMGSSDKIAVNTLPVLGTSYTPSSNVLKNADKFYLAPINGGIDGAYVEVANTLDVGVAATEFVFDKMDAAGTSVTQADIQVLSSGKIRATTTMTNQNGGTGQEAVVFAAVYKDNVLYSVDMIREALPENTPREYGITVTVPDLSDGVYEMKAFAWNGDLSPAVASGALAE